MENNTNTDKKQDDIEEASGEEPLKKQIEVEQIKTVVGATLSGSRHPHNQSESQ